MKNRLKSQTSVQLLGVVAMVVSLQAPCQQTQDSSYSSASQTEPGDVQTAQSTTATSDQRPEVAPSPSADESAQAQTALDELLKDETPSEATSASSIGASDSAPQAADNIEKNSAQSQGSSPTSTAQPYEAVVHVDAKDEPEPVAKIKPSPASAQLEEIVVTATKREESVRKIPATITAITGQALEATGAREMKDFLNQVPGINLESSSDHPAKISIRGVGPGNGANQTTGILFEDTALTDPYGTLPIADPDPFDMRDVEILKGPQGTLFGASALNGAIRYVPNHPELGEWSGKMFADWITVKEGSSAPIYGAMLNVPIGDSIALRGSGVLQYFPGVIDITYQNKPPRDNADTGRKWTGRGMLRWDATDRLNLNLSYMQQERNIDEFAFVTNRNADLQRNDAPTPSAEKLKFSVASLDARYDFDWATLVSLTARQTKKVNLLLDGTYTTADILAVQGIQVLGALQDVDAEGYTQELRLVSPNGEHWTWLAGGIVSSYKANIYIDNFVPLTVLGNIPALATLYNSLSSGITAGLTTANGISVVNEGLNPLKASERALFGELTRTLGEDIKLTFGGRFYKSHVGGTSHTGGAVILLSQKTLDSVNELAVDSKGFNPKVTASWQLTEDIFSYANISRGFQFGGVNFNTGFGLNPQAPPPGTHPTFKSSTIWNYEVGVRTDWLDRTLRADITVFHLDWKNPQIYQITPNDAYVDNVGGSSNNGVEGTLHYLTPISGVSLSTAGSYIIAKISKPFTSASGNVIPVGTDMPLSPRLQATATVDYAVLLGSWAAGASLLYSYQGKAFNDIDHVSTVYDYSTINFSLNIARPDLKFRPALTLSATNLTDTRAVIGDGTPGTPNTTTSAQGDIGLSKVATTYNRPRAISLRFSAEF